jgi:hypothetical protein
VQAFFEWAFYYASLHLEMLGFRTQHQSARSQQFDAKEQENPMKVTTMSAPRLKSWLLLASLLLTISAARLVQAQIPVGTIEVCYNVSNCFFEGVQDGPIFLIHNTSGTDITNGVLTIGPGGGFTDSFKVGTIAAGTTFGVAPGISDDGQVEGHNFFQFEDEIRDTSEIGPNGNNTQFRFTGSQGSLVVDSGVFTPGPTQGPSLDRTVSNINFLGGPGNNDGPCNRCFDKIVANLNAPSISLTNTVQSSTGAATFDFAPGGPVLTEKTDYAHSNSNPSDFPIFVKITLSVISDSGWGNKYDSLTVNTRFFGTKCLHREINGIFGCVVSLYQCSKSGEPGTFTGAACPLVGNPSTDFVENTQEFANDLVFSSITGAGVLEGADNALTCTTPGGRPACENLQNVFFSIAQGSVIIKSHPPATHSIFIPGYLFH